MKPTYQLNFIFKILLWISFTSLSVSSNEPAIDKIFASSRIDVAALILARCGSKGIRFKNLVTVENESLLRRTVITLKRSGKFTSIWVATDCNTIAHEAFLSGASVFRRTVESATDTAPSIMAVKEFLVQKPDVEVVALFQCTSPFLALPFIHSAFGLMSQGYDSVFSVNRLFKLRWQVTPGGAARASNFDPARRPRRQDWDGELVENGMFYFTARRLVEAGVLQGGRIGVVEIPSNCSLEIDTEADLAVAVSLAAARARRGGGGGGGGGGSGSGRC